MAERIERPIFYEGQILSAADLDLSVEYARGRDASGPRPRLVRAAATLGRRAPGNSGES